MRKRLFSLAAVLFFSAIARAADYAPDVQFEEINDFSGGLYTNAEPHKIPKNFSPNLRNVLGDEKDGSLKKFKGYDVLGSTASLDGIKMILPFDKGNENVEFIVSDSSRVLSTADFQTYQTIKTGLNKNLIIHGKQIGRKVWVYNGSDATFTYDGSTVVVLDGQTYSGVKTPNVPRGQCMEYDLGRVWVGNTVEDDSYLFFSEPKSTDSVLLAPDDYRAWPASNLRLVGQGDGTPITFIKSFRGRVFVGKTYSIYSIFGENRFSFNPIKTSARVGFISQDSVTELDNLLYGQAKDGFYSFNGDSTERLTDRISPDIQNIRSDTSRIVVNTWDTQTEFETGATLTASTTTTDGFLTVLTSNTANYLIGEGTPDDPQHWLFDFKVPPDQAGSSTSTPYVSLTTQVATGNSYSGWLQFIQWDLDNPGTTPGAIEFIVRARNRVTGREMVVSKNFGGLTTSDPFTEDGSKFHFSSTFPITLADIRSGNLLFKIEFSTVGLGYNGLGQQYFRVSSITALGQGLVVVANTTGSYLSQITTVTNLNSWSTFDSVNDPQGGAVQFYYRTATATVNIATYPWISITPGGVINSSSTNSYVQWAATMTAISTSAAPNIDLVTIEHIEGSGVDTRSFGIAWMNRLWIFVSTEPTRDYPLLYIKSRSSNKVPDAWWPGSGYNVNAITKFNNILYGGSASGGTFYRMDYGTSRDGSAVDAYYYTPEFVFGNTYFDKTLLELWLDAEFESSNNLILGISLNGGAVRNQTLSLNGSGRATKKVFNLDKYAKSFQFVFRNYQVDKDLQIHNIVMPYLPHRIQ